MDKLLVVNIITDDKQECRDIESKLLNAGITSVKFKFRWLSFTNLKTIVDDDNYLFIVGEKANSCLVDLIKPFERPVIKDVDEMIKRLK